MDIDTTKATNMHTRAPYIISSSGASKVYAQCNIHHYVIIYSGNMSSKKCNLISAVTLCFLPPLKG